MLGRFLTGAGYAARGLGLLTRPGIKRYVVIPLLINVGLFSFVIYFGINEFGSFLDWLLPSWLDWARWILWPLFGVASLLIVFYTFTLIANVIAAPFNALLSEKLEQSLTGGNPADSRRGGNMAREAAVSVAGELQKLAYLALWALPLLLLFLIPVVNLAAPFIWAAFSAWMLSIEYADYPMSNNGMRFRAERALLREHKPLALGFGGLVMLMTMIPVINFIAMPTAVAGATAMWVEQLKPQP